MPSEYYKRKIAEKHSLDYLNRNVTPDQGDKIEVEIRIPRLGVRDWFSVDFPKESHEAVEKIGDLGDEIEIYLAHHMEKYFGNKT